MVGSQRCEWPRAVAGVRPGVGEGKDPPRGRPGLLAQAGLETGSERGRKPGPADRAGRSHLEILRRRADVAVAGQARAAAVFSPPPLYFFPSPLSGGRSGGGGPPLGAPASRQPRAKRERGCGPSARQTGGTPALPGNSPMSGIGKVPVRAAQPPGQPPSRPPPFQGGGEKIARPASLFGHRARSRTGPPDSSPLPGAEEWRRTFKCDCPGSTGRPARPCRAVHDDVGRRYDVARVEREHGAGTAA